MSAANENMVNQLVVSVLEFSKDVSSEVIFDFPMASDRLAGTCSGILVPIVTTTVPDENTSAFLDLANQVNALHAS